MLKLLQRELHRERPLFYVSPPPPVMHIILPNFYSAAQLGKVYILCIITDSSIVFLDGRFTSLEQSETCMAEILQL